jgi:hypothetical protein
MEEKIKRVVDILKSHGIEMAVGGCGCCGSPWVYFKYNGEVILDNEDDTYFDTEDKKNASK